MQMLELTDRAMATEAAGILRLANALDAQHGQSGNGRRGNEIGVRERTASSARAVVGLEVELQDRAVVVRVAGYSPLDRSAEGIAAARHLLETVLRRPVIVRLLRRIFAGWDAVGKCRSLAALGMTRLFGERKLEPHRYLSSLRSG
jgi:hypothetical protein